MKAKGKVSFETDLAELEAIVQRLESGELALEEALQAFERGIALIRSLHGLLSGAEQRVEVLTRDAAGGVRLEPLPQPKNEA